MCELKGGLTIYRTATDVEGFYYSGRYLPSLKQMLARVENRYFSISTGCHAIWCMRKLADDGYAYVEAQMHWTLPDALAYGTGVRRYTLKNIDDPVIEGEPNCDLFMAAYDDIPPNFHYAHPWGTQSREIVEIVDRGLCIATEDIDEVSTPYHIREGLEFVAMTSDGAIVQHVSRISNSETGDVLAEAILFIHDVPLPGGRSSATIAKYRCPERYPTIDLTTVLIPPSDMEP